MFRNGKDKPSRTSRNQNNKTKAPSYAIFLDVQPRTYRHSAPLQPAPKCPPHPNFVIPEVPSVTQTSSFPKCPPHPNFVIPEVPSAPKLRHSRSALRTQTSSFPKCPLSPNFVIPEIPSAPKLRHSARSRRIHLRTPTHSPYKPAPPALHYGYCDFAQYDGVGRATAFRSSDTILPSFHAPPTSPEVPSTPKLRHPRSALCTQTSSSPKCPPHPNFVIPEVPSVPKLRHSARSRRIHLRTPTHSPYKPAPPALHYGYCDFAQYDGVGKATAFRSSDTILPSFHAPPTSPEVPSTPKLRHPRSTLCPQTSSFCAQSQNPSPHTNALPIQASTPCTPLWILRLRAV